MIAFFLILGAVSAALCLCCFLADRPRPARERVPQPVHVRLIKQEPRP